MLDYSYLNLSAPALYLETLAINKGRETASSQRFSYFGSLAEGGGGGDGACVEYMNNAVSFPATPAAFARRGCGLSAAPVYSFTPTKGCLCSPPGVISCYKVYQN